MLRQQEVFGQQNSAMGSFSSRSYVPSYPPHQTMQAFGPARMEVDTFGPARMEVDKEPETVDIIDDDDVAVVAAPDKGVNFLELDDETGMTLCRVYHTRQQKRRSRVDKLCAKTKREDRGCSHDVTMMMIHSLRRRTRRMVVALVIATLSLVSVLVMQPNKGIRLRSPMFLLSKNKQRTTQPRTIDYYKCPTSRQSASYDMANSDEKNHYDPYNHKILQDINDFASDFRQRSYDG